jgi:hypothetical protein
VVQNTSISSKVASPNAPLGYGLCLLNLGLDGFTNASQDSLTARFSLSLSPHVYHCTRIISRKQKISVLSCELLCSHKHVLKCSCCTQFWVLELPIVFSMSEGHLLFNTKIQKARTVFQYLLYSKRTTITVVCNLEGLKAWNTLFTLRVHICHLKIWGLHLNSTSIDQLTHYPSVFTHHLGEYHPVQHNRWLSTEKCQSQPFWCAVGCHNKFACPNLNCQWSWIAV